MLQLLFAILRSPSSVHRPSFISKAQPPVVYLESRSRSIAILAPNEIQREWSALWPASWQRAEFFKSLYSVCGVSNAQARDPNT